MIARCAHSCLTRHSLHKVSSEAQLYIVQKAPASRQECTIATAYLLRQDLADMSLQVTLPSLSSIALHDGVLLMLNITASSLVLVLPSS